MEKTIEKVMHLGIDFWKDFGGFLDEKMNEHRRNIDGKIDRKSDASWNRFLKGFSLILTWMFPVRIILGADSPASEYI